MSRYDDLRKMREARGLKVSKVLYYTVLISNIEIPDLAALCNKADALTGGQLSWWSPRGDKTAFGFRNGNAASFFILACRNSGIRCQPGPEWPRS